MHTLRFKLGVTSLLLTSCAGGQPVYRMSNATPKPMQTLHTPVPVPTPTSSPVPTPIPTSLLNPGGSPAPNYTPIQPIPHRPTNLAEGLIAHYAFDGNVNSHDGLHDAISYYLSFTPKGITGQAGHFFGSDASPHAYVFDKPGFDFSRAFTFSAWVSVLPYQNRNLGWPIMASRGIDSVPYAFYWTPGGAEVILNQGDSDEIWVRRIKSPRPEVQAPDNWQHWAATYDGKFIKIYFNGKLDLEVPYTRTISPKVVSKDIFLGRCDPALNEPDFQGYAHIFQGDMDELRIYNRALKPEEVGQLYQFK